MRCEDFIGLLDLYMDSELPEEMSRRVDKHILRCPACAYEVKTLEQTRGMLREAIPPEAPALAFLERASARLRDAFAPRFPSESAPSLARQWTLPFAREEREAG